MAVIEDFGEKIGGSRKDKRAYKNLEGAHIEKLNLDEITDYINKDKLWEEPNYIDIANKKSPVIALYIKEVRDAFQSGLAKESKANAELAGRRAKEYVEFISQLKNALYSIEKEEEINGFFYNFFISIGFMNREHQWLLYVKGKEGLTQKLVRAMAYDENTLNDKLRAKAKVIGFPYNQDKSLDKLDIRNINGLYYVVKNHKYKTNEGYKTGEELLKAYKQKYSNQKVEVRKELHRRELEENEINWKKYNKDVTADQVMQDLGLRGGEFGTWNTNKERQMYLNVGYGAFLDLAETLNVPSRFIGLGLGSISNLAIAFGARGTRKGIAHYEQGKVVINLTKVRGAGSLAHEWGHALDHALGSYLNRYGMLSASELRTGHPIEEAMVKLMDCMMYYTDTSRHMTEFYAQSRLRDKKRNKKYFTTREEMFARAFESFISHKIVNENKYLVHSVGPEYGDWSKLFPQGEELERISVKMIELFNVIRREICNNEQFNMPGEIKEAKDDVGLSSKFERNLTEIKGDEDLYILTYKNSNKIYSTIKCNTKDLTKLAKTLSIAASLTSGEVLENGQYIFEADDTKRKFKISFQNTNIFVVLYSSKNSIKYNYYSKNVGNSVKLFKA